MALNKVYTRINWEDYPSENTDLDAYHLNQMDSAIDALDNRIISQDALKVDKSAINGNIADWTMDETTGVITITKYNGEKVIFDLNIEKIPVDFSMSDDGIITMTTEDGTQFTADIGSMIPVLTFEDSATISVSVTGTGKNKTYSFAIKTGSVTEDKLQPNFLADVRVESANAAKSAQNADADALLAKSYSVGGTGTREGEDVDNAKYYMEQAKQQTGGIPTKVSELENDAGYIKKSVSDLLNYYDKTTVDEKIDAIPKTDLANYLTKTGDGSNLTAAFEEATTLEELTTGEKLSSIFGKLKLAVKNLKSLISLIGTTDISTIGDGTTTGAISALNESLTAKADKNGTECIRVTKDVPLDGYSFANAPFVAETTPNAQTPAGYGFHNAGSIGMFFYMNRADANLRMRYNNNADYALFTEKNMIAENVTADFVATNLISFTALKYGNEIHIFFVAEAGKDCSISTEKWKPRFALEYLCLNYSGWTYEYQVMASKAFYTNGTIFSHMASQGLPYAYLTPLHCVYYI